MTISANGNGIGLMPPRTKLFTAPEQSLLDLTAAFAGAAPVGTATRALHPDGDPVFRCSVFALDPVRLDAAMDSVQKAYGAVYAAEVAQLQMELALCIAGVQNAKSGQWQCEKERSQMETKAQEKADLALKRYAQILKAKRAASALFQKDLITTRAALLEAKFAASHSNGASGQVDTAYVTDPESGYIPQPLEEEEAAGRGRIGRQLILSSEQESPLTLFATLVSGGALGLSLGRDLTLLSGSLNTVFEQGVAPYFCMALGIAATYLVKKGLARFAWLAALKSELAGNVLQRAGAYLPLAMLTGLLLTVEVCVMRMALLLNPMLEGKADFSLWLVSLPLLLPAIICGIGEGINRGSARASDLKTADIRKREHEARVREALASPQFQQMLAERGVVAALQAREKQILAEVERVEAPYVALLGWEEGQIACSGELILSQQRRINELLYDASNQMVIFRKILDAFVAQIRRDRKLSLPDRQRNDGMKGDIYSRPPVPKLSWWRRFTNRVTRKKRG